MKALKARLYDQQREALDTARSDARKSQVGSGDRSERIRTYNFPQGRVTDHRINLTLYNLPKVMEGEALDEVIDAADRRGPGRAPGGAGRRVRLRPSQRACPSREGADPVGAPDAELASNASSLCEAG